MPRYYSERVGEALKLAADAFAHSIRKATDENGQRPIVYLSHLLQVAAWVAENRGDEDQIIAAVLHDYLEDIEGASSAALEQQFGSRVARLVGALSDATDPRNKPPWKQRKVAYLARLRHEPAEVKLISACDKLHNAASIVADMQEQGDAAFDRFQASKEETLWYYQEVTEALADGWDHPLVGRVRHTVRQMTMG